MSPVLEARQHFEQAQNNARDAIDEARASFGLSIKTARDEHGIEQAAIAKTLGLTREQIRKYERYYEDWREKKHREPVAPR
jgi:DNA-binding XRE family transcriptional regulator